MIHGKPWTYAKLKCRCARCVEAVRAYRKEIAERPTPEHYHGTLTGYTTYDCRCYRCAAHMSDYQADYYRRNKGAGQ